MTKKELIGIICMIAGSAIIYISGYTTGRLHQVAKYEVRVSSLETRLETLELWCNPTDDSFPEPTHPSSEDSRHSQEFTLL